VLRQGRKQFIQCVTANLSGCDIGMTVYLAGIKGGIDSAEIRINTTVQAPSEEAARRGKNQRCIAQEEPTQ